MLYFIGIEKTVGTVQKGHFEADNYFLWRETQTTGLEIFALYYKYTCICIYSFVNNDATLTTQYLNTAI